jgi:GT2 family glycosyltransferase
MSQSGAADVRDPVVSVIVLGWNGRRYVDACLGALLDQAGGTPEHEVIWADNGSVDGSPEYVAAAYPSVRVVRFERNLGYAGGNVAALSHARARYVAFLNQDTVVGRSWIRSLLETQHATGAAAVHSNMILPWQACAHAFDRSARHADLHVAELSPAAFVTYRIEEYSSSRQTLFVSGAGFLIDRKVLPRIGGLFDPRFFAYCEDTDLALRLASRGYVAVVAGEAVLLHDLTPDSSISVRSIRKTLLILRNRILACARSMTAREFVAFLPSLVAGAAAKADELPMSAPRRALVRAAMVGLTLVALVLAAYELPHHAPIRRVILTQRVGGRFATVEALRAVTGTAYRPPFT